MRLTTAIVAVVFGFILLEASVGQLIVEAVLEQTAEQEADDDPFAIAAPAPTASFDANPATLGFLVGGLLVIAGAAVFANSAGALIFSCAALIAGVMGAAEDGTSPLVMIGLPVTVTVLTVAFHIDDRDQRKAERLSAERQAVARYR